MQINEKCYLKYFTEQRILVLLNPEGKSEKILQKCSQLIVKRIIVDILYRKLQKNIIPEIKE